MCLRSRRTAVRAAACLFLVAAAATFSPLRAQATRATVTRVNVKMIEYRFILSVRKVQSGTVVFTMVNKGQLPHTFAIQRLQRVSPLIQPGRRALMRVTFRKPGKYYYLCTVGAHVQYGMYGTLTVIR
jgi:plastocyanin